MLAKRYGAINARESWRGPNNVPGLARTQLLPQFDSTNGHARSGPKRGLRRRERFT